MTEQDEVYKTQKNVFQKIRDRYYEVMESRQTIDRLMKDKVSDYYLMEEFPLPIKIGGRTLWIGNLTLENNQKFLEMFSHIIGNLTSQIINMDIIADASECFNAILRNKKLQKELMFLVKKTLLRQQWYYNEELLGAGIGVKIRRFSYRYFKRHVTAEKLAQIMFLIHQYNFDGEKKNLKIMAEKMGIKQNTQTYIYSWLQNLAGLTGNFVRPQSEKSDLFQQELTKKMEEEENNKAAK